MNLSILVLLPFLGAALPPLVERFNASRTLLALSAAVLPALALGLMVAPGRRVSDGDTVLSSLQWLPSLGLGVSLFHI